MLTLLTNESELAVKVGLQLELSHSFISDSAGVVNP